jgi:hypothetical protein
MMNLLPLAYIDPGTGVQLFSSIGPMVAAFLAACGAFLLWPIKKFVSLFSSKKKVIWFATSLSLAALGIASFFIARSFGLL